MYNLDMLHLPLALLLGIKSHFMEIRAQEIPEKGPFFIEKKNSTISDERNFSNIISNILSEEGGLVNSKDDPGGITNYGISLRFLKNEGRSNPSILEIVDYNRNKIIDGTDVKNLSKEMAILIYKKEWWDKYNFGSIKNEKIAAKVFSLAINMGPFIAIRLLQKSCHELDSLCTIKVNGKLDDQTVSFLNELSKDKLDSLLSLVKSNAISHYKKLAFNNPNLSKFLKGWIKRANK